jgi:hypothetical protein
LYDKNLSVMVANFPFISVKHMTILYINMLYYVYIIFWSMGTMLVVVVVCIIRDKILQ